jgi:hypothetical protein
MSKYCPHQHPKSRAPKGDCDLCSYDALEKREAALPAPTLGARRSDPSTSHAAHRDHDPGPTQQAILAAAAEHGPGTEQMFAEWCGIERTSISPQFRPMIRAGKNKGKNPAYHIVAKCMCSRPLPTGMRDVHYYLRETG